MIFQMKIKWLLFFVASLMVWNLSAQNGSYKPVKQLKLTKAGIKAFNKFSQQSPAIIVKDLTLFPGNGYRLWISKQEDSVVVIPEEISSLEDYLSVSDSWERRKYPWPGGGTYTTTCWCVDKEDPAAGDDCEFDNSQGDEPIRIKCAGSCGCNRTHIWETTDIAEWIYF